MTTQPLRVGPLARRRLERRAREDAAALRGAPASEASAPPTVAALQARANAYARREEQRFHRRVRRELSEHRMLAADLRTDLDAFDERIDALPPAERDHARIAVGDGPVYVELRRLERRISRGHRRAEQLAAVIHAHFTAARLRAARHFDRSDEKIAVYWGMYRGALTRDTAGREGGDAAVARAPELRRADWLTTARTDALEHWQGGADGQA
ncbi:hypothetical protein [Leifsonia sp. LS1]|uniref:hypothetical protein n=1 Tax=Leifsonia sp. LS1 TaxID=2828483 RepID=UPI001CFDAB14|nr:hypothetical protein [Leifsonia sp. LS1]